MGSATTHATAASTAALDAASGVDLTTADDLFAAGRAIAGSSQLLAVLADAAAPVAARTRVVDDVFGAALAPSSVSVLRDAVSQRWSSSADLVGGIEELAVRAASIAEPATDVESELFEVTRTVAGAPELELALGSRLGEADAKGALISSILTGRASAATTLVVTSLVRQLRGRRVRSVLQWAMRVVAEQRGRTIATVFTAAPLSDAQAERLATALRARFGAAVSLNTVVDPDIIGGLRVQIGDDVIDASIASRLADLRQRLAG